MSWQFFNNHLEIMFLKLDPKLIIQLIEVFVQGLGDTTFEVQTDSCNSINSFCEFVYEKLKRAPTKQSQFLVSCV